MSLSSEQASALVGSSFVVHTQQGPIDLMLADASERPRRALPEQFRTPLSLIFHGPGSVQLTQGLYTFDHPALGRHQWMLVPVLASVAPHSPAAGSAAADLQYEVIFA